MNEVELPAFVVVDVLHELEGAVDGQAGIADEREDEDVDQGV